MSTYSMNLLCDTDDRLAERNDLFLFLGLARDQSDWDLASEFWCYQLIQEVVMEQPSEASSVPHQRARNFLDQKGSFELDIFALYPYFQNHGRRRVITTSIAFEMGWRAGAEAGDTCGPPSYPQNKSAWSFKPTSPCPDAASCQDSVINQGETMMNPATLLQTLNPRLSALKRPMITRLIAERDSTVYFDDL